MGCLCCKPPAARPRRRPATLGSENPIYETIDFPLRPRAPPPPPPPRTYPPGAPLPRRRNPPPMPPGGPVLGCRSRFALPDTDEPVWTDGPDAVWNPSYGMVAAGDAPPDCAGDGSPDDDDEMHYIVLLNLAVSLTAGEMQDVWTTLKEVGRRAKRRTVRNSIFTVRNKTPSLKKKTPNKSAIKPAASSINLPARNSEWPQ